MDKLPLGRFEYKLCECSGDDELLDGWPGRPNIKIPQSVGGGGGVVGWWGRWGVEGGEGVSNNNNLQ